MSEQIEWNTSEFFERTIPTDIKEYLYPKIDLGTDQGGDRISSPQNAVRYDLIWMLYYPNNELL
ncbi:MAG: hypothetical protein OXC02_01205 [Rhodobacteraceae bacterium]|nr:hypothetical protein [Paracoccaceae bacterium]